MRDLPLRVRVALAMTVLAVIIVLAMTVFGGSGSTGSGSDDLKSPGKRDPGASGQTTTTAVATTTTAAVTTTSIEIPDYWYPKSSSRYSDRKPPVTVTTIASPDGEDEPTTVAGD